MHDTAHISDSDLLADYLRSGDEHAFAALVTQHQRMVIGAAWRRTGDAELARDIAQEVFATLAQKAAWLADRRSIAGWLYTTTVHLAWRARESDTARRLREERFSASAEAGSNNKPWPLLEDALRELPSADREAVVLHFLEDRSYEEMARTLGLSEVAARKRVSRALKNLGVRLRRRGFASGAASLLAGAVGAQASVPVTVSAQTALSLAASGSSSSIWIGVSTLMSHLTTKVAVATALMLAAPIAWQSHANSGQRAELAALQSRNTALASTASVSGANANASLQRELDAMMARFREVESTRVQAERELAAVRLKVDQIQREVHVSFGKSEDVARQVAAKMGPLMEFEAIKAELKKNPSDPRLRELAKESGKSMTDLLVLSTQIARLEEDPAQYARFNAVLYGEVLGLDAATQDRLEAIFLPAFEQLRRDGLTIRNRPQQESEDWLRRRGGAEELLWRQVEPVLPPEARNHPLLAMGEGDLPPVLFTSQKAFGEMFPTLGQGDSGSLKAAPPKPASAPQQP